MSQLNKYDFRNPNFLYETSNNITSCISYTTIENSCPHCNQVNNILVHKQDLEKWKTFYYVQEVFTWLNPCERQTLISGIHSKCWNIIFS